VTIGEEDFEPASTVLKEDTTTACELTILILSISVTFSVICFPLYLYEIMPATLANTLLFISQGSRPTLADLDFGGRF